MGQSRKRQHAGYLSGTHDINRRVRPVAVSPSSQFTFQQDHQHVRRVSLVNYDVARHPSHIFAVGSKPIKLLFAEIGLWRQQLRPEARVHGIVLDGGTAANIIPSRAVGRFMLRSVDEGYFHEIQDRFREMVQGAALATGCGGEAVFSGGSSTMKQNEVLRGRFSANLTAYGLEDGPLDLQHLGSSDMGNVSQHLPTIHPYLAIAPLDTAGHSTAFRDAAGTPQADEATLLAATLIAQTAYELFADPSLVSAAWAEFRGG